MHTALPARLGLPENLHSLSATRGGRVLLALSANALLALCAHLSVPLFFTPVPLTLQTFAVVLTGLLLGPSLAFSAVALYLAEGAVGLPVFSPAGPGGIAHLLGFTGGFLLSYPFAAAAAGLVSRTLDQRVSRFAAALAGGAAATAIIFLTGGVWLAHLTHASWSTTAALAITPFVPGEIIKIIAAAAAFSRLRPSLGQ